MSFLRSVIMMLAVGLLALQVLAGSAHQHPRHAQNSSLEARYDLEYPYRPWSPLKRGLPFNNPSRYIQNFKGDNSHIAWAYNWDSYMDAGFPGNIEYVPMLWSDGGDHTANWFNNVNNAIDRGCRHLLAFNEPDACDNGGSCMSPQQAADAYRTYLNPFAGRAYLGTPAVTNGPNGIPWLQEFLRLCTGCHIDYASVHWYDSANNDAYFYNYMNQMAQVTGLRLWITEFSGRGSTGEQIDFLRRIIPWLDSQSFIARYAWFWADPNSSAGPLVDGNANPTDLGNVYTYL